METDKYVFFTGGIFSNWMPSKFTSYWGLSSSSDIEFNCAEQYMMLRKALMFADFNYADLIMNTNDPALQKQYGKMIKNYDDDKWAPSRYEIVKHGIECKFNQNPDMMDYLISTGDKTIVEAAPWDKIWGIGMDVNHPDILDESKWQGTNLLGKALMDVRSVQFDLMKWQLLV